MMVIARPQQAKFISDFSTKFIAMVGGNRCGKTYGGAEKAVLLTMYNGMYNKTIGIAIEPTYDMAIKILKPALEEAFRRYGIEAKYKTSEHVFVIPEYNNSLIYLFSGDKPERIEAVQGSWVWGDEPAQWKPEVFTRALTRMNDPNARILQTFLTGTPEGLNHYYKELFSVGKDGKQKYKIIYGSIEEIRLNTDPEYISRLENFFDPLLLREKLFGEFVNTTSGRVYYAFDESLVIEKYLPQLNLPVLVSCDFNINPCVWNVSQYYNNILYTFDEVVMYNANTNYMCQKLSDILNKYGDFAGYYFYGDYTSIKQRTTATSLTDWGIIEQNFKNYRNFKTKLQSNPKVKERVETQNSLFSHKRHYITRNCKYLIDDYRFVVWDENGYELEKKKDKDRTHASDGVGYMINIEFGLNKKYSKII